MKRILIQLDTDPVASTFDSIVATDAGVDMLLTRSNVDVENVTSLVHGAMFTRRPDHLASTAIFIGGQDVPLTEKLLAKVQEAFFGPVRVSVMLDANGSGTTAAAAVRCVEKHVSLKGLEALVLGGTGPVGQRTAEILASHGAHVRIASRSLARAEATAATIRTRIEGANVTPCESSDDGIAAAVDGVAAIIAAGAAGAKFLSPDEWQSIDTLKVAVDLNAVPPAGLEGIEAGDAAVDREGIVTYGAVGVGGLKMKIHKAAIEKLFAANDQILDTAAIYALSQDIH